MLFGNGFVLVYTKLYFAPSELGFVYANLNPGLRRKKRGLAWAGEAYSSCGAELNILFGFGLVKPIAPAEQN